MPLGGGGGGGGGDPPMAPSPLRSWWKLASSDFHAVLLPETTPTGFDMKLPLLSVSQTLY